MLRRPTRILRWRRRRDWGWHGGASTGRASIWRGWRRHSGVLRRNLFRSCPGPWPLLIGTSSRNAARIARCLHRPLHPTRWRHSAFRSIGLNWTTNRGCSRAITAAVWGTAGRHRRGSSTAAWIVAVGAISSAERRWPTETWPGESTWWYAQAGMLRRRSMWRGGERRGNVAGPVRAWPSVRCTTPGRHRPRTGNALRRPMRWWWASTQRWPTRAPSCYPFHLVRAVFADRDSRAAARWIRLAIASVHLLAPTCLSLEGCTSTPTIALFRIGRRRSYCRCALGARF
mmetsp:Transcript_2126/g.6668  ORF Transcript_2126/g.6668 Transcript_2126/m.6668 type:complete len:286 (+) Transcript_2126:393-1250(+)